MHFQGRQLKVILVPFKKVPVYSKSEEFASPNCFLLKQTPIQTVIGVQKKQEVTKVVSLAKMVGNQPGVSMDHHENIPI